MEIKGIDRVVIAKPVASRPTSTGFKSFSKLLSGAINASPPPAIACSKMAVAAIRPKLVRVKPTINEPTHAKNIQADRSGGAPYSSFDNSSENRNQSIIFKPLAKVVSKETISLLLSMGNCRVVHQQALSQVDTSARQERLHLFTNQLSSNLSQVEFSEPVEPPTMAKQMLYGEPKMISSSTAGTDRPSCDGYNWRKYGQKQVKGSEYPRSYYKCTHPKCVVKKKVERSLDGQITEIVYKGEHDHPKPDYIKRSSTGAHGQEVSRTNQELNSFDPKLHDNIYEKNEGFDRQTEKQNAVHLSKQFPFPGNCTPLCHPIDAEKHSDSDRIAVYSGGIGGGCEEVPKRSKADGDWFKSKRRKQDDRTHRSGKLGEATQEPRSWVHNTEPEIMGDGFRWRKYGQKVVKGNTHPRSYFRCTSVKCKVRKYVERALDDPRAYITTYEGRHNHEMPMKFMNHSAVTKPEAQTPTSEEKRNSSSVG